MPAGSCIWRKSSAPPGFEDPHRRRLGSSCNDPIEYLRVCSDDNEWPGRSATIGPFFVFSNFDDSQAFFQISPDTLIGESKMHVHLGSHAARGAMPWSIGQNSPIQCSVSSDKRLLCASSQVPRSENGCAAVALTISTEGAPEYQAMKSTGRTSGT